MPLLSELMAHRSRRVRKGGARELCDHQIVGDSVRYAIIKRVRSGRRAKKITFHDSYVRAVDIVRLQGNAKALEGQPAQFQGDVFHRNIRGKFDFEILRGRTPQDGAARK